MSHCECSHKDDTALILSIAALAFYAKFYPAEFVAVIEKHFSKTKIPLRAGSRSTQDEPK